MSVSELKDALREALERKGELGKLRASIRSSVFSAMEDQEDVQPAMPGENIVINELIREYLAFNNYKHTLAVFSPEAGLPPEPLRRPYIGQQTSLPERIGAAGADPDLPLLYGLMAKPPQALRLPETSTEAFSLAQSPSAHTTAPSNVPLVPSPSKRSDVGGGRFQELPMARQRPTKPVIFT